MPVSYSQIPANWKVPLYWAEVDPSMAGLPVLRQAALMAGVMTTDGDATPDVAVPIATQSQADARFGQGSEMSRMFTAYFRGNFANEAWGVGVEPPLGGARASGVLRVSAPAPEGGTIHLYIGGEHVAVNIGASDTDDEIAAAIADAVNAIGSLPVTAAGPGDAPDGDGEPASMAAPFVSGRAEVGAQLFTSDGEWSGDPTTFTYAWQRGGTTIAGAAGASYTLTEADEGAMMSASVTASNDHGEATAASDPVGPVEEEPGEEGEAPANMSVPVVSVGAPASRGAAARRQAGRAAEAGEVILTCKWAGVSGNDINVSVNYFGRIGGEVTPIGLNLELPATGFLTGGVGVPNWDETISNLGETAFEYVAMPYTDATSLRIWEEEYGFGDQGRWGWMRQLYGHIFSARRGNYPGLITFGDSRNQGVTSVMGFEIGSPSPAFEWAAAYTAKAQRGLTNDPARPLQTLRLNGIKPAPHNERFIVSEINLLAHYGIATQMTKDDNVPMISRETTTYQLNLYGFQDDAYELVTTLATLARLMRNQRHAITSKFGRHKLGNDGTRFGPGQAIVTPGIIKSELIAEYRMDEFNGLVEDTRSFKRHLIVERDPNNANRMNVLYPPDLINQLRMLAVLAQFRLQYDRGLDLEIAGGVAATGVTGFAA